jgi:hypothetical protein
MQTQDINHTNSFELLSEYLKSTETTLPAIRYWSGTECFSDSRGRYKSPTLAGSIALFLKEQAS